MKFYLATIFAFVAVSMLMDNSNMVHADNLIDKLVRQALEVVRKMLKDHEPLEIPDIPAQHIVDRDIDINIELKQVKVSKASDFTVDHIENDLANLWAKFGVTVPKMHLEGQYVAKGVVEGRQVQGSGQFKVDINKFVQTGKVYLTMVNHNVQMKELDLDYDLNGLNFDLQGLSIEGMTKEQVETLLNKQFFQYLQTNKKDVCGIVSRQVMIAANKIMEGKTLKELLDWLKKFIQHTA